MKNIIAKYFGLIDSYKRIVELERVVISLTSRVFKLEEIKASKDAYIDSVLKHHSNK